MSKRVPLALALLTCGCALAAPGPAAAACPNEAFRPDAATALSLGLGAAGAALPDCRAYEQASPVDKDGTEATATVPYAKASSNGDGVTFISKSGIPGGVGAQEFPSYLAGRDPEGWSTHGLLPPATEGQVAQVLGWTPDFSEVFTKATRLGNPSEVELLATPRGGAPVKVVDYTPALEPKFLATAKDGSLLFESRVKLVEGAAPGRPNTYLWDHASGKLSLAGVLNDGSPPLQGAIGGPYDWIRGTTASTLSEGGGERDYYTEAEHALARNGSAAFFTAAGSGRLYERLNPGAEQSKLEAGECTEPAKACTVEISASQKTNGAGPGGSELGGPRPAAFQAASADGKVAYFTSPEELTDDAATGPEPSEPPPPAFISSAKVEGAGPAEEVAPFVPARASGLATDSTYLYWADAETGAIGRTRLDGTGSPEPGFITGLAGIEDLAVGEGHIYWTVPGDDKIGRAEVGGGHPEPDFITGAEVPKGVAVGGGFLYWTNEKGQSLGRAEAGGAGVDEDFIRFTEAGKKVPTQGVAVDPVGGHIYVALAGVYILSYELDGSKDPQELEQGELAGDIDLALDGEHLYWNYEETAGLTPSVISRSKLDLSEKEQQFITEGQGVQRPQSVATANGHVYWANDPPLEIKPGSELYRYQASTGALEDVSAGSGAEDGAEVQGVLGASRDGSVVYFVANGDLDGAGPAEAGDCTGLLGHGSGQCSLYRWQAGGGDPSFVARLDVGDGDDADWAATTSRVFPDPNFQKTAQVSGDGKVLLFHSGQQLTPYDNTPPNEACGRTTTEPFEPLPCPQLYLYRAGAGVSCVSCDPSGAAPAGAPDLGDVYPGTNTIPPSTASLASRNLAADGNKVFFETPDALVPADTNGEAGCPPEPRLIGSLLSCLDVYEWEAAGSGGCAEASPAWSAQDGGCLYLLSTGKGTESAALADASESGDDVFFFTRARLVGQDEDELTDVYDARVDGGLAAQSPPAPAPACEETEACHGAPPAPPPPAPGPATPGFHGPGNPKPKCKRSQVRRHGKCSRRHKQRKGHRRHRQKHGRSESGRGAAR